MSEAGGRDMMSPTLSRRFKTVTGDQTHTPRHTVFLDPRPLKAYLAYCKTEISGLCRPPQPTPPPSNLCTGGRGSTAVGHYRGGVEGRRAPHPSEWYRVKVRDPGPLDPKPPQTKTKTKLSKAITTGRDYTETRRRTRHTHTSGNPSTSIPRTPRT